MKFSLTPATPKLEFMIWVLDENIVNGTSA
jgi:hypothetical protein